MGGSLFLWWQCHIIIIDIFQKSIIVLCSVKFMSLKIILRSIQKPTLWHSISYFCWMCIFHIEFPKCRKQQGSHSVWCTIIASARHLFNSSIYPLDRNHREKAINCFFHACLINFSYTRIQYFPYLRMIVQISN